MCYVCLAQGKYSTGASQDFAAVAYDSGPGAGTPAEAVFEGGDAPPARDLPSLDVTPPSGNTFVDAFINNGRHYVNEEGVEGPFVIDYFFDRFDPEQRTADGRFAGYDWRPFEKQQFRESIQGWSNVANVAFNEVGSREEALFRERLQDQPTATGTVSASHNLPPADPNAQSLGTYNFEAVNVRQWTPDQLEPGGNFYRTFIHEIGHGLGLKHPHDNGSLAYAGIYYPGVEAGPDITSAERQRDLGYNDFNHMFGSVMSYIHGYEFDESGIIQVVPTRQRPVAEDFFLEHGFAATPMAYDIAATQYLYGANMGYRTGDNVYVLPDSNDPAPFTRGAPNEAGVSESIIYQPDVAFWECIWDAGGTDEMRYDGARNTIIDLRAATLDYAETSRGVLSYAAFIGGGYTIANGVVVENATGGEGNDLITGNAAANILVGRGGADVFEGGAGNDTIHGGDGLDTARVARMSDAVNLRVQADGSVLLEDLSADSLGTDVLWSVERIAFADRVVEFA